MTKEQERAELHKTIWRIANDLRGSVDGWDFKSYVLGMLFYRFISENITQRANALVEAAEGGTFDYTRMADDEADVARSQMVSEIGYFILPSELFTNVQQRAAQDETSAGIGTHHLALRRIDCDRRGIQRNRGSYRGENTHGLCFHTSIIRHEPPPHHPPF